MDVIIPYCELLNTHSWHDCAGNGLEFKRGLGLLFWSLLMEVGCGRVWVSGGLIRWKLSEEVLPFSPPFFPDSLCLLPLCPKLAVSLRHAFWASESQMPLLLATGKAVALLQRKVHFCMNEIIPTIWSAWREKGPLQLHANFCLLGLWGPHGNLLASGHHTKCELECLQVPCFWPELSWSW